MPLEGGHSILLFESTVVQTGRFWVFPGGCHSPRSRFPKYADTAEMRTREICASLKTLLPSLFVMTDSNQCTKRDSDISWVKITWEKKRMSKLPQMQLKLLPSQFACSGQLTLIMVKSICLSHHGQCRHRDSWPWADCFSHGSHQILLSQIL